MLRLLAVVVGLLLIAVLIVKLLKAARNETIDWRTIGVICAFVALAFWLRHVTGIG
jgi:hypothetical protein